MALYHITGTAEIGYWLALNLMRDRLENITLFGPYDTKEAALAYHDGELAAEPWDDVQEGAGHIGYAKTWRKVFKKGSPLEWMNPLHQAEREEPGFHQHGVHLRILDLKITSQVRA
jgi:hypothetical protein